MNRGLVLGITVLLGYWGLQLIRGAGLASNETAEQRPMPPIRSIAAEVQTAPQSQVQVAPVVTATVDTHANVVLGPQKPVKPFAFQRELDAYAKLQQKVILTDEEKAEKSELLKQGRFLRALVDRLVEPSIDPQVTAAQDVAVTLLLDAVKGGDAEAAAQALTEVVQDAQVESSSLAQPIRAQLAGIKGEVLYHWSALDPSKQGHIARRLPGPVSQRIWQNVLAKQASNRSEI